MKRLSSLIIERALKLVGKGGGKEGGVAHSIVGHDPVCSTRLEVTLDLPRAVDLDTAKDVFGPA